MKLNLNLSNKITPEELQQAKESGHSLARSADLGNMKKYNQAFGEMGAKLILMDENFIGGNGNPEIEVGKNVLTNEKKGIITRIKSNESGEYLDQIHLKNSRKLAPNSEIITETNYIQDNIQVFQAIVESAFKNAPEIFKNAQILDKNSAIPKKDAFIAEQFAKKGAFIPLLNDPRHEAGLRVPGEIVLATEFLTESILTQKPDIFHGAGNDMAKYISGKIGVLNKIFSGLNAENFPEEINVSMPNVAPLKLSASPKNSSALDQLIYFSEAPSSRSELHEIADIFSKNPGLSHEFAKENSVYIPDKIRKSSLEKTSGIVNIINEALKMEEK